ncbi:jg25044, partial [Pararge aegeria aegeria]
GPTYLLFESKADKDSWLYHLTVVSGGGLSQGTHYEQLVQKLMETDGDPNCVLWRHPNLLYSKENITTPLTSLNSEALQAEALKLFKCVQLFMSVAVEHAGIDYHVVLAQNALQQCLEVGELQDELASALCKQTAPHAPSKHGVQVRARSRHRVSAPACLATPYYACRTSVVTLVERCNASRSSSVTRANCLSSETITITITRGTN